MASEVKDINAYLVLRCAGSEDDHYRSYSITVRSMVIERPVYVVNLQWGKPEQEPRSCRIICTDHAELQNLLRQVLRARLRYDYRIVERSESFPESDLLEQFEPAELSGPQQPLFKV